jgi:3'(2'), 5'-bisphosphate nucleotidase
MEKELEIAKDLAREAGRVLLEIYKGEHDVQWKGRNDPVTAADRAADELIVHGLRRHFPSDGILSEEAHDDGDRLSKTRVWMVDPMDGTQQFIEHIGEFAVMIGLSVAGEAQLGVVYHPTLDRMYVAAPGLGAFVEEHWTIKRLRVSALSDPSQMVAAMSRSHHSPVVDRIRHHLGITREVRSGSVGLKFGLLAEGRAHLYIHPGSRTNQWDTCAPEAILRAAGGRVTDATGAPLRDNTPETRNLNGIVASNGLVHEAALAAIAAVRAER